MHEVRYSFRPGLNGASIAGPHCFDKPGGVRIAPDCLRNYGLSAFLPFSNFHALPLFALPLSFVDLLAHSRTACENSRSASGGCRLAG
jgi:hypothetical protein